MKYIWQVIERETEKVPGDGRGKDTGKQVIFELPEMQCGVTDTFEKATRALSAWQGAEDDPPHRLYQIIPMLESEYIIQDVEAERIRITAFLSHDTTYTNDFCIRCSHEPTNCECTNPVYMAG